MKLLTKFLVSAFILTFVALSVVSTGCSSKSTEGEETDTLVEEGVIEIDEAFINNDVLAISVVKHEQPVYDKEKETYSMNVSAVVQGATQAPKITYKIVMKGETDTIVSTDGKFEGLKPLKGGRSYVLVASCQGAEPNVVEIQSVECPIIPKIGKMSKEELQKKLNDSSMPLLGYHEEINPDCVFHFTNLEAGKKVDTISDIYECIEYDWDSVTVKALEYDEYNRISKIVITINY